MIKMALSTEEYSALSRKPITINQLASSYDFRPQCYRGISKDQWQSYAWQWKNRILTLEQARAVFPLTDNDIRAIRAMEGGFSIDISPHYAALIRNPCEKDPLWLQAMPSLHETEKFDGLLEDPLGESRHAIARCAVKRYPDRALLYAAHDCAMRCRHCTRRARVGKMEAVGKKQIFQAIDAIKADGNARDVLISGGDPLSLANATLRDILAALRECPHIDVIRLCSRMPCTLPQRCFDRELLEILREFEPIYLNTQFNHPNEASEESRAALENLRHAGCILGNQSVLLKNINDSADTLEPLYRWLLKEGCRPYYLFLCDVAQGTRHFRTSIGAGLDVMHGLRGRLSGLAIPHFVIDLPDGYGKVDLCKNPIAARDGKNLTIENWFGARVDYEDMP